MKAVAPAPAPPVSTLPRDVQRYARSGQRMGTLRRDLVTALNQVHPYVWGGIAVVAGLMARRSHKQGQKKGASAEQK